MVGVCIPDRLGTLSVISGLFTNSGLDIVRADTFTLVTEVETPLAYSQTRASGIGAAAHRPKTSLPDGC